MDLHSLFTRYRGLILPVSIIACIGILLVPLPPFAIDVLLAGNLALALIILLTTISVRSPVEFSVFPSLLVATTLGRLVLNVGTTRLILTGGGSQGESAAGGMIRAFGNFVAGDMVIVGVVIFAIIVLIQFLVITKGATRISEVAARFALDGMPGKQLAIDAELNSGAIDNQEAQRRRLEVARQADFYGGMDGASKFVRGDAIAGICITLVNIVGGLAIGFGSAGMTLSESVNTFTKLTIGDGLASQIPALLISVAAALLVTRSTRESNLPNDLLNQVFNRPQSLLVVGVFVAALLLTDLPKLPLLMLGAGCCGLSFILFRQQASQAADEAANAQRQRDEQARRAPAPEELLSVDPLRVEIGMDLLPLADPGRGGDLMQRITNVRNALASEMGFLLPKVRLKDNLDLPTEAYRILLSGNVILSADLRPHMVLAVDVGRCRNTLQGLPTQDPLLGREAIWIDANRRQQADAYGYRTYGPTELLATHLETITRRHADELLTREQTRQLIDQFRKHSPAVVEELIPDVLKLAQVQRVLQLLLAENVPVRQLGVILEAMGDAAARSHNPYIQAQCVRDRLSRTICQHFGQAPGQLQVVTLDNATEDRIAGSMEFQHDSLQVRLPPREVDDLCRQIDQAWSQVDGLEQRILLVRPAIRAAVREMTRSRLPHLVVLSFSEVTFDTQTVSVGIIGGTAAAA